MKADRFIALIVMGTAFAAQGCAATYAIQMPGAVADERVAIGMPRDQVETHLGVGAASQYEQDGMSVVRYDYKDGVAGASKARAIPYVAADIFTAFLSELVFWPIEVYAKDQIVRVGTAKYDANSTLVEWQVSRKNGELIVSAAHPSVAAIQPSAVSANTAEPIAVTEAESTSGAEAIHTSDGGVAAVSPLEPEAAFQPQPSVR